MAIEAKVEEQNVGTKKAKPNYSIIGGDYADGIKAVKAAGCKPFSFEQNIEAIVADYEANGKDAKLFNEDGKGLASITGIVYAAGSSKFKVIPNCTLLENFTSKGNRQFMEFITDLPDYSFRKFKGVELDSEDPSVKYNQSLTREEAKTHKAWLAAVNGNKDLLAKYVDAWFDTSGKEYGMSFNVIQTGMFKRSIPENMLSMLFLWNSSESAGAYCNHEHGGLRFYAKFISSTK
jgi:hypothetical protein